MTKEEWANRIKAACKDAGTYMPYFDTIIETLAEIMEMRDSAVEDFKANGSQLTIERVNTNGFSNEVKNPTLTIIDDLNKTALAYWRDLGLTPAGLKRLNADAIKAPGNAAMSLGEVLKNIGV